MVAFIDNITFHTVPEPGPLVLLAAGLAAPGHELIRRSYTWESAGRALWEAFGGCELASAPRKNC